MLLPGQQLGKRRVGVGFLAVALIHRAPSTRRAIAVVAVSPIATGALRTSFIATLATLTALLAFSRSLWTPAFLFALAFLPIAPEHYDFLVVDIHRSRPAVRAFLAALAEPAVRERIAALGMAFPDQAAP